MSDASTSEPQTPAEAELRDTLRSIHGVGEGAHGSHSIDDLEPDAGGHTDADGSGSETGAPTGE
jgi:hypothetical protein